MPIFIRQYRLTPRGMSQRIIRTERTFEVLFIAHRRKI